MKTFLKGGEADKGVESLMTKQDVVVKKYEWIVDYYMLDKKDEGRAKSEKFFIFFTEYIDKIQSMLPKVEKPKPAKKAGSVAPTRGRNNPAMANMMAEMKAKQAM